MIWALLPARGVHRLEELSLAAPSGESSTATEDPLQMI